MNQTTNAAAQTQLQQWAGDLGEEIDLRNVLSLLLAGRKTIAAVTLLFAVVAFAYVMLVPPTYDADGLIQVERNSHAGTLLGGLGGGGGGGDLSALTGGGASQAAAEVEILQSRLVLLRTIEQLHLDISVAPKHFPIFGSAVARWNSRSQTPVAAWLGLSRYAWGGEKIDLPTLEVPEALLGRTMRLKASADGYELIDTHGTAYPGRVGEPLRAATPEGVVTVFVRSLKARPGTLFSVSRSPEEDVIKRIKAHYKVNEQGRLSGVIELKYKGSWGESREDVAAFIDTIEEAYQRQNIERRSEQAKQSLDFLQKQLPEMRARVDVAQERINVYQKKNGTINVSEETEGVLKQSVTLDTRRLTLTQQREEALQRFTPEHPSIKALDEEIHLVDDERAKLKGNIAQLPTTQQDMLTLLRDLDVSNRLYISAIDTVQQLQVAEAGTVGNVRVIDRALRPYRRASPRRGLTMLITTIAGLFVGIFVVFVQRAMLRGLDDPAEIESRFGLTTYGMIPYAPEQRRLRRLMQRQDPREALLVAQGKAGDTVVEAIRSLRTSLHFALMEAPNNIVMFTGPSPALGKSFISINLAATVALSGKKVLVIDGDLRRGYLHQYFGHSKPSPGIAEYMLGNMTLDAIIQHSKVAGLDFLQRGEAPSHPAEMLMSDRFNEMILSLAAQYDYVFIDSPPVLAVADAAVIGQLAGCVLLVLKAAEHPVREIEEVLKRLNNARVHVRGVVLNQVGARAGSYGYGNYGYQYHKYD